MDRGQITQGYRTSKGKVALFTLRKGTASLLKGLLYVMCPVTVMCTPGQATVSSYSDKLNKPNTAPPVGNTSSVS